MQRYLTIISFIWMGIFSAICYSDSWLPAGPVIYSSNNKNFTALVIPGSEKIRPEMYVYHEKNQDFSGLEWVPWLTEGSWTDHQKKVMEKWQQDSRRKLLWNVKLENKIAPVAVFVSDDGRHVVTLDNWHRVGYGDEVVAFYGADGLIKKYDLETIIPFSEIKKDAPKKESDENTFFVDVSDTIPEFRYRNLFSHTASSRWWREHGLEIIVSKESQYLFGVWLPWKKDWLIWDMATGKRHDVGPVDLQTFNRLGRKKCLDDIDNKQDFLQGCFFLTNLKKLEDRSVIETMLSHQHFSGGLSSQNDTLLFVRGRSEVRATADMALAIWDGQLDSFADGWDYKNRCLGQCEGELILPKIPIEGQKLYIYFVPEGVSPNQWVSEPFLQALSHEISKYALSVSKKIAFKFSDLTPGRYRIKAIYEIDTESSYRSSNDKYAGGKGDWENSQPVTVEIKQGQCADKIEIHCDHKIE
ncbi:MAG: hypothetical protein ACYSUT_11085 [Planctomycetota bacterium]